MNTKKLWILVLVAFVATTALQANEERAKCEAFPAQDSCIKSLEQIASIKTNLDECCTELDAKFDNLINQINNVISPCSEVTPIFTAFTINQSGRYCLAADITSGGSNRITINADNVILDLNNHTISAGNNGIVITNQSNVVIMNGKIQNTGNSGINVQPGSSSIVVSNIEFRNADRGILFNTVSGFRLNDCEFIGNGQGTNSGIDILSSNNGIVRSCFLHDGVGNSSVEVRSSSSNIFMEEVFVSDHVNGSADFSLDASSNISCRNCSVSGATGGGGKFSITGCSNCLFDSCQAVNNGAGTGFCVGFRPSDSTAIIFNKCYAARTLGTDGVGFQFITNTTASCMINCQTKDNSSSGVRVEAGSTSNFFFGNVALGNTTNGFVNGVVGNAWHANYASANGTDYVAVPVANIKTYTLNNAALPANTVAWNNIAGV